MSRALLITGGVLNSLLAVFHVFLGHSIYRIRDVAAGYRALMIMLNAGGTLFIVLIALASLALTKDMLTTKLGKLVTLFTFLLYASRALEEVTVSTQFSITIFGTCIVISAIYAVLFFLPRQTPVGTDERR